MSRLNYLLVLAATFLVLQYARGQKGALAEDLAIDVRSTEGLKLQVPFLPYIKESWPDDKRKFYLDGIEPIIECIISVGDEVIGSKVSPFKWIKIGAKLIALVTKAAGRKPPPGMGVKGGPKFARDTLDMIGDILDRGDQVAKSMEDSHAPKDKVKLKHLFHAYFQTILEGMRASKVVFFVDWRRGTVDGLQFPEYSGVSAGSLKYNGYGAFFTIIRQLLAIAKKFIPPGTQ